MREKIVAGNWKMNLTENEAISLVETISINRVEGVTQIVFPPFIYLTTLLKLNSPVLIGAQNFYPKEKGAFTGEVSISQLKSIGVTYVLVGHSERRTLFNESNEFLKEKVDAALNAGIKVVFCCGEPLEIRKENTHESFVNNQLEESLFHLTSEQLKDIIIAYEPIWAIGTGLTASSEQAEAMHLSIRKSLTDKYGAVSADAISILYGGSCNPSNAHELFTCPNVDGGLIGGASLKADEFHAISTAY
jgi:triosephosphate isomerase